MHNPPEDQDNQMTRGVRNCTEDQDNQMTNSVIKIHLDMVKYPISVLSKEGEYELKFMMENEYSLHNLDPSSPPNKEEWSLNDCKDSSQSFTHLYNEVSPGSRQETSTATVSVLPSLINPHHRIIQLEKNIAWLSEQHSIMFSQLHNKIELLKNINRDLQFQLLKGAEQEVEPSAKPIMDSVAAAELENMKKKHKELIQDNKELSQKIQGNQQELSMVESSLSHLKEVEGRQKTEIVDLYAKCPELESVRPKQRLKKLFWQLKQKRKRWKTKKFAYPCLGRVT